MSHHIAYCEKHDVSFQEGEYCPISESTGEACEFSADAPVLAGVTP